MGGRVLARAAHLLEEAHDSEGFSQVVLAAPDIDSDVFTDQDAAVLLKHSSGLTLYASARDRAIRLSATIHGGVRRAGDGTKPLVVLPRMETVDASEIDTDLIGHGYFAENKAVIDDLFMLIEHGFSAGQRNLREETQRRSYSVQRYYVLR